MTASAYPAPPSPIPETSQDELEQAVIRVAAQKTAWIKVSTSERIQLLNELAEGVLRVAERWVEGGCRLKGIDPTSDLSGEEWFAGPMVTVRNIRMLAERLALGDRQEPVSLRKRGDQEIARVFPRSTFDKLAYQGMVGEIWIEPKKPSSQMGTLHANKEGRLALVLGAGNVSSIPPMDVLYKLFAENEVVVLKMNPVNEHVGPRLEEAFAPLVQKGFLAIVYGGADVGSFLANHPKVDTLHVTGSDRTYDAIVWGSDPAEQKRRKTASDPINKRPFTAELGCVTPVMLVPGDWSSKEIDFQARHVVSMVAQNGSFNCNAAKVLVLAKEWAQKEAFLERLRFHFKNTPARKAYYPGAQDRYKGFLKHYPNAEPLGGAGDQVVPWTLLPDVAPQTDEYALNNEAFCGVLAVTELPGSSASAYLKEAVAFANDRCWGTLSCCLLIDPRTKESLGALWEDAIADLRYGGIGINCWPAVIYGVCSTTWGAYPGHPTTDIRSGAGVVHNTYLFDHPQKSVISAPFRIKPTPVWFADHKNLKAVGKAVTYLEARPSWMQFGKVLWNAMKG